VRHFAWDYARQAKVFSVDLSQPENAAIAARFGLRRYPSFVAIYKGKTIRRFDGAPASERDLRRLLSLVGAW
jgi:thioredoxin-like negative regulator of GroEL